EPPAEAVAEPAEGEEVPEPEPPEEATLELSADEVRELLAEDPTDQAAHRRAVELHEPADLVALYRDLCSQRSDAPELYCALARAYVLDGKPQMAVVQFQKAIKMRPDPDVSRELAATYEAMGKPALAAKVLATLQTEPEA
ncbi:MAG: hypothetical protein AB1758_10530, partial [Candidatus Eremiobacterota bacterium]